MSHIRKSTWNALLRVLIIFAFVFSTPVLAVASAHADSHTAPPAVAMTKQMQVGAHTNTHAEMANTHAEMTDTHIHETAEQDCGQVEVNTSNICCEDEDVGNMPCGDSDGCKTVCTGINMSPAVLGASSNLRHFATFVRHSPYPISTHSINLQHPAPPPRA